MTTVFHAWSYGRFIEKQSNFRRKKLHRMNQDSNFLGGSFRNRDNLRAPIQSKYEEKVNSSILKDDFSSRADPSIFTSIVTGILDWSSKTCWGFWALKSTNYLLAQTTVSCRSEVQKPILVVAIDQMPYHI